MKVVLEVHRGPGEGKRYEVGEHVYRTIGRLGEDTGQDTVVLGKLPTVTDEERAAIDAHMAKRRAVDGGSRPRAGAFQRGADILLDDALTSRTHAMVFVDEVGASLVDLGSTNGTFVNAEPVTDAELGDGDVIHIGRARFVVSVRS